MLREEDRRIGLMESTVAFQIPGILVIQSTTSGRCWRSVFFRSRWGRKVGMIRRRCEWISYCSSSPVVPLTLTSRWPRLPRGAVWRIRPHVRRLSKDLPYSSSSFWIRTIHLPTRSHSISTRRTIASTVRRNHVSFMGITSVIVSSPIRVLWRSIALCLPSL